MHPSLVPDYALLQRIGTGAYGEVWLGRSTATGALRAVKIVHRDRFTDARPFEREFDGLRRFEEISRAHPSQLALFHVGRAADGSHFYYVMELADAAEPRGSNQCSVNGNQSPTPTVPAPLRSTQNTDLLNTDPLTTDYSPHTLRADLDAGRLPAARVLELGLALAEALDHLHGHGLVHRDIKPSNIIFVAGRPKLADIGLVTDANDQCSIVGTEGYLPPEGPGTPAADVFALGKVLYEALTGLDRRKFPELPGDLRQWPDARLALELNAICLKACARLRDRRYAGAPGLLADLRHLAGGRSVKGRQRWQRARRQMLAWGALTMVIGLGGWGLTALGRPDPAPVVAVLPFETAGVAEAELAARLTEEIRAGLARVPGLAVVGQASSEVLHEAPDRLGMARSNRVDALLEGRLRRDRDAILLALELSDPKGGRILWTETLRSQSADVLALATAANEQVPRAMQVKLTDTQRLRVVTRPTASLEAYRSFQEGRHALWITHDFSASVRHLRRAVELDPAFALAWAELANACGILAEQPNQPSAGHVREAAAAANKAIELAPDLAEAHVALASVRESNYDWTGAEAAYRRALKLNPDLVRAHHWLGYLFQRLGRHAEARPHRERALALDPYSAENLAHLGNQLASEGRHREALEKYREAAHRSRVTVHIPPNILRALGLETEALESVLASLRELGEPEDALQQLRAAHREGGWPRLWATRLRLIENRAEPYVQWHVKARLYALQGRSDEALACLARSVDEREPQAPGVISQDAFKPHRADPRYRELRRRMNLQPSG